MDQKTIARIKETKRKINSLIKELKTKPCAGLEVMKLEVLLLQLELIEKTIVTVNLARNEIANSNKRLEELETEIIISLDKVTSPILLSRAVFGAENKEE
ncbi:MAG: hypothetical protein HYW70_01015 [Candidatus Nealsonbacteria bacterium]|nr:hypothetical protein [Candidatus Nealsonbacteria bacterium]